MKKHKHPRPASKPEREGKPPQTEHKPERLQKIMATAGLGSRRMLEQQISEGAVKNRLYRAREKFRQIYESENEP